MGWRVDPPGFRYDARTKVARFSIVVPGTNAMRRRKKTIGAPTRDKALSLWREFHDEVVNQTSAPPLVQAPVQPPDPAPVPTPTEKPTPLTLARYVGEHFAARKDRVRPATWASYEWIVRAYVLPRFGGWPVSEITMPAVRDFAGSLTAQGLGPSTVNRILAVVRMLVREAFERGCINSLPLRGRMPMQKEPVLRLEMSDEERHRFLAVFEDREAFGRDLAANRVLGAVKQPAGGRWSAPRRFGGSLRPRSEAGGKFYERFAAIKHVFVVALETGLRKSDLLALQFHSVDLEGNWIRVVARKTGREATIPITRACRAALDVLRDRADGHDFACTDAEGKVLSPETFRSYFERAKRLAGITRRCRIHDMRHTLGARLSSTGANLQMISAVLAHSTTRLSERYSHPSAASLETAFRRLETEDPDPHEPLRD